METNQNDQRSQQSDSKSNEQLTEINPVSTPDKSNNNVEDTNEQKEKNIAVLPPVKHLGN